MALIADLPPRHQLHREARDELPSQIADFEPQPMVANFSPIQLLRTAFRTFFAHTIAGHLDRRETMASLPSTTDMWGSALRRERGDPSLGPYGGLIDADLGVANGSVREAWIDFVGDIGDGWNPAYSTALVVARSALRIAGLHGESPCTSRGGFGSDELPPADLLVLGGDQVYPTPSRQGYTDRLVAPLACALPPVPRPTESPVSPEQRRSPLLFAIPGNHDWYDGLTDFIRVFCQGGLIGRWRLRQRRSYFAVRLPRDWWLWGIDIQLDTRIDPVQLAYFRRLAERIRAMPGRPARIILCTAKPAWIYGKTGLEASYKNLMYFERQILGGNPASDLAHAKRISIPVTLSGDMHHYCRYVEVGGDEGEDERQRITCGAGGAYLRGTHSLPRRIAMPGRRSASRAETGDRELIEGGYPYPSRSESRRLGRGALRLPLLPRNWGFCVFVGALYALLAVAANVAMFPEAPASAATTPVREYLASLRPDEATLVSLRDFLLQQPSLPLLVLVVAGMLFLTVGFALMFNQTVLARRLLAFWGALHGAAHVMLALALGLILADMNLRVLTIRESFIPYVTYGEVVLLGGLLGGFLVGTYLVLSARVWGWHEDECFSVQSIQDYRSFLRMRIAPDGSLTIYPIGIARVPRQWRKARPRRDGDPLFVAADAPSPRAHLIESPVVIPPA